jgi:hypothetical protein
VVSNGQSRTEIQDDVAKRAIELFEEYLEMC